MDVRARKVDGEYRRALQRIDRRYHGTTRGESGPLQRKLELYGEVQGLVFGVLGEVSQAFHNLLDQVATARATYLGRMSGQAMSDSERSQLLHNYRRRLSCAAVSAQAQCLLARVGYRGEGAREAAERRRVMMREEQAKKSSRKSHFEAYVRGRAGSMSANFFVC